MIPIIGLVVVFFLLVAIASIGMVIVTIALFGFVSFVSFFAGGLLGASVAGSFGVDAQVGYLVGSVGAVALLWLGMARFGSTEKMDQ